MNVILGGQFSRILSQAAEVERGNIRVRPCYFPPLLFAPPHPIVELQFYAFPAFDYAKRNPALGVAEIRPTPSSVVPRLSTCNLLLRVRCSNLSVTCLWADRLAKRPPPSRRRSQESCLRACRVVELIAIELAASGLHSSLCLKISPQLHCP